MRITPLASGSQGNSTLIEVAGARILIDLGLPCVELERRLAAAQIAPRSIDAAVLTHRHRDHVRGATEFCRRHRVRVFATRRTSRSIGSECNKLIRRVVPERWFEPVDGVRVMPVGVEHDAPDTVALLFEAVGCRYGHATDLGSTTGGVRDVLSACDVLYLEFNYEPEMLVRGSYPEPLKRRIASDRGHLSNAQAAELLAVLAHPRLQHVFVAHVSRENNTHEFALAAARGALVGFEAEVSVAQQDLVTKAVEVVSYVGS